jgi:hypothetical protein
MDEEPCPACGRKIEDKLLDRYLMAKEIAKERAEVKRLRQDAMREKGVANIYRVDAEVLRAEVERLQHDVDRYMAIANEHVNEVERLMAENETLTVTIKEMAGAELLEVDRLRAALKRIAGGHAAISGQQIAREALNPENAASPHRRRPLRCDEND